MLHVGLKYLIHCSQIENISSVTGKIVLHIVWSLYLISDFDENKDIGNFPSLFIKRNPDELLQRYYILLDTNSRLLKRCYFLCHPYIIACYAEFTLLCCIICLPVNAPKFLALGIVFEFLGHFSNFYLLFLICFTRSTELSIL